MQLSSVLRTRKKGSWRLDDGRWVELHATVEDYGVLCMATVVVTSRTVLCVRSTCGCRRTGLGHRLRTIFVCFVLGMVLVEGARARSGDVLRLGVVLQSALVEIM